MPITTALTLALLAGFAAAFSARVELRVSPKPAPLTAAAAGVGLFLALVLVPASAYFYAFHGDWFLLYFIDSHTVPSALALLGFVAQWLVGMGAFMTGAVLVRSQRESVVAVLACVCLVLAFGPLALLLPRLKWVGTYLQFSRNFGLSPYGAGPLFQGTVAVGGLVAVGLAAMLLRVRRGTGHHRS